MIQTVQKFPDMIWTFIKTARHDVGSYNITRHDLDSATISGYDWECSANQWTYNYDCSLSLGYTKK